MVFLLLLLFLPLLLLLHYSISAAQCQTMLVEVAALLHPRLVEGGGWTNVSSCRLITFHQEQVFMTDFVMDCLVRVDMDKGEMEVMGTECDQLEEQGLLVDQMGSVMVELEEEEKVAVYSNEGLYLCKE